MAVRAVRAIRWLCGGREGSAGCKVAMWWLCGLWGLCGGDEIEEVEISGLDDDDEYGI